MTCEKLKIDGAAISIYYDAPQWSEIPTAAFGDFSCKTQDSGAEIIAQAIEKVRATGIKQIIGPMNGDTWHNYRFVTETDNSPSFLLEPTNKPHEVKVFMDAGFENISDYCSMRVPLTQTAQNTPHPTSDFTIETWDGENPEHFIKQVFAISAQAFTKNAFYKPINESDFLEMYLPIIPMVKKELIFFARRPDSSLAGFLFGIPNYAEGPNARSVIIKTYASLSKGAGQHLIFAFHKAALSLGYETAIHALMHNNNQSAARSAAESAYIFRRYELLGLRLNG